MNAITRSQIARQIVRAIQGRSLNLMNPETITEIESWERLLETSGGEKSESRKPVRLLRLIEYVGTPEFINDCLARRNLKGTKIIAGLGSMREAILGDATEILNDADDEGFGVCRPKTI